MSSRAWSGGGDPPGEATGRLPSMAPARSEEILLWSSRLALVMARVINYWCRGEISRAEARREALAIGIRVLSRPPSGTLEGTLHSDINELPSAGGDDVLRLVQFLTQDDGSELVVAVQYKKPK